MKMKIVEPLPEILEPGRDGLDLSRGESRTNENAGGDDPSHHHRISHRQWADMANHIGLERYDMFFLFFGVRRFRRKHTARDAPEREKREGDQD
jgi:hypothetical protein